MTFTQFSKKALCLMLVIGAYQSTTQAMVPAGWPLKDLLNFGGKLIGASDDTSASNDPVTFWGRWAARGVTVAAVVGALYYRSCYKSSKKKFEDHELVRDAYDAVQEARASLHDVFSASEAQDSKGAVRQLLAGKFDTRWVLKDRSRDYCLYHSIDVCGRLRRLTNCKTELESKKSLWAGNKAKALLLPQLEITLRELNSAIPVLELVNAELLVVRQELQDKITAGTVLNRAARANA